MEMTESRRVSRRMMRSCVDGCGRNGGRVRFGDDWWGGRLRGVSEGERVLPLYLHVIEQIGE